MATAIRRLTSWPQGEDASEDGRQTRPEDARSELATQAIEKIIDLAAPPEERDQRRQRLTKGPPEFREARIDQPKAKGR